MEIAKRNGTCLATTGLRSSKMYYQCAGILRSLSGQTTGKSLRSLVLCLVTSADAYTVLLHSLIKTEQFKNLRVEIYSISSPIQLRRIKDSHSQIVICAYTSALTGATSSSSKAWNESMEIYLRSLTAVDTISCWQSTLLMKYFTEMCCRRRAQPAMQYLTTSNLEASNGIR